MTVFLEFLDYANQFWLLGVHSWRSAVCIKIQARG